MPVNFQLLQRLPCHTHDLCFLGDDDPESVVRHLALVGVPVELGPVIKRGARGPIASVYCRDPDGSLIEIASYPEAVPA